MPLHSPSAYPTGLVMTRFWCRSTTHDDGQLNKARNGTRKTSAKLKRRRASTTLTSSFSSSPSVAASLHRSSKFTLSFPEKHVIHQVRRLPSQCFWVAVAFLLLFFQPVMSKPWSNLQPDYVVFRSKICQPVSPTDLQKLMGPHYDRSRMSSSFGNSKRNYDSNFEDSGNQGYQADEPRFGLAVDSADFVEGAGDYFNSDKDVFFNEREEDIYTESNMVAEIEDKEFVERRTLISEKNIKNKRVQNRIKNVVSDTSQSKSKIYANGDNTDYTTNDRRQTPPNSYSYMRRRRRRTLEGSYQSPNSDWENPSVDEDLERNVNYNDYDDDEIDDENDSKDKKSTDNILVRLFFKGKDKKTRKYLKKKLRQKLRNFTKPPPWECKFVQSHKHMKKGIFPDMLLDGRCETDKCFYRLYNCDEIHYVVKLLERDPDTCNPLPSVSNVTVYEERWNLIPYKVTVGCNCVSPYTKSSGPKSKSKNRQRGQF